MLNSTTVSGETKYEVSYVKYIDGSINDCIDSCEQYN